jgi:predicted exporter
MVISRSWTSVQSASRRRLAIVLIWLVFLSAGLYIVVARTPVEGDLTAFLPRSGPTGGRVLLEGLQTGPASRLVLIALQGESDAAGAALSKRLADMLRASQLFLHVSNGQQLLSDADRLWLAKYRYLLSPKEGAERFSAPALRVALKRRLRELASPVSVFDEQWLPLDPTGEMRAIAEAWQGAERAERRHGVWFSPDGRRALLLAETRAAGFDVDAQREVVQTIRHAFVASSKTLGMDADTELLVSGPAVFAADAKERMQAETQLLSVIACSVVMVIIFSAYRSRRIILLSALPLASAVVMAAASTGLMFGSIHGITLAFGITLVGVAIDYPVHLFSHLHRAEKVENTLHRIWPTLALGAVTSAIGYLGLATSDFPGLIQLGVFAVVGLLTAAVFTGWVLPALLPEHWAPGNEDHPGAVRLLSRIPTGRTMKGATIVLGLGLLAVLLTVNPPKWEEDLAALSPVPPASLALDRQLRSELGAPEVTHVIVVQDREAEGVLLAIEKLTPRLQALVSNGLIDAFDAPTHYLPSMARQRARQKELPQPAELQDNLHQALAGLPFKRTVFRQFLDGVEESRGLLPLGPEDLADTMLGLRVSSTLYQKDGAWIGLVLLSGVTNHKEVARWFSAQDLRAGRYVNIKTEMGRLVANYRNEALKRLAWGAAAILLVLWLGLGAPGRIFRVVLPVALAIVVDVFALTALGKQLSLFHLVSLLLVVGIGLDYSLFFSRPDAEMLIRGRTLHAVLVCAGSTVAVFGILALSEVPVLDAIGTTVAIGAAASLITAGILAPGPSAGVSRTHGGWPDPSDVRAQDGMPYAPSPASDAHATPADHRLHGR